MNKILSLILILSSLTYSLHAKELDDIDPVSERNPAPEEFVTEEQESPVGIAAAQSAEEPKVSNKTWRRVGLIAAGVTVAAIAIYTVSHDQGQRVHRN